MAQSTAKQLELKIAVLMLEPDDYIISTYWLHDLRTF